MSAVSSQEHKPPDAPQSAEVAAGGWVACPAAAGEGSWLPGGAQAGGGEWGPERRASWVAPGTAMRPLWGNQPTLGTVWSLVNSGVPGVAPGV